MKAGAIHCRCAKCFTTPARKRVRKRAFSLTLLSLPEEIILCVLQYLPVEDLLAVRVVHSRFRDLIDADASLWTRVCFKDQWPSPKSIWLFERAAEKGNFEAAVKLGIAYLYNEGPSLSDEGRAEVCGRKASHYFSLAESLRPMSANPFVWVFIRPPWSPSGSCCKAVVYARLQAHSDSNLERRGTLLHCLARVLRLFDDEEKRQEALKLLEMSACSGCVQSAYLLWEEKRHMAMTDPGRYLQCVRTLRDYAAQGCWEAQLFLAKLCISGNPLGLEQQARISLVAQVFQSNLPPWRRPEEFLKQGLNDTMRYILVDWLVEVTTMKDFSSLTLHVTVGCVDRFLAVRSVPKARLQLLGIACMVICTRYVSKDILTIREAVWLTDNTYQYEDLVRMMGEVVAVLGGKIRTPTLVDYAELLQSVMPLEKHSIHLFCYICELSLLYASVSAISAARLACAILLLTRALHHNAPVWPPLLADYTGTTTKELVPTTLMLYLKCFSQDVPKDYRHVSLTGVKQRFEDETYQYISKEPVMALSELCQLLDIPEIKTPLEIPLNSNLETCDMHTFLSSSSHNKRRKEESLQNERSSFLATPTAELSSQEEALLGDILEWSLDTSSSGYEGDKESEEEKETENLNDSVQLKLGLDLIKCHSHCRALSSDDSLDENQGDALSGAYAAGKRHYRHRHPKREALSAPPTFQRTTALAPTPSELHSSGYSSVQSSSPSLSALPPCCPPTVSSSSSPFNQEPAGFRLMLPVLGSVRKRVKRKNGAAHSGEEMGQGDQEGYQVRLQVA